ncbi:MAG: aldose epimerase family protein [Bacteroidota bacterium]
MLLSFLVITGYQCKNKPKPEKVTDSPKDLVSIKKSNFGETEKGESVMLYKLKNAHGMAVDIMTYGGTIISLKVPDRDGNIQNVVLGYDSLAPYLRPNPYFGSLIGRYGNRIAKGRFSLDGKEYELAKNNGENHLHGGIKGFDKVVWQASEEKGPGFAKLILAYTSADMEEGYPGNLDVVVTYTLTDSNELEVLYEAVTDKKTIVNLTQHAYFNLSGDFGQDILDHGLQLYTAYYLPVDGQLIPTGKLASVKQTPFDFTTAKPIGKDINADHDQIGIGLGYDHCWAFGDPDGGFRKIATVKHPNSGRVMDVFTTEPGVQFYSGNFLDGSLPRPGGGTYGYRSGLCLETEHYPDSPNRPEFPSTALSPGEKYTSKTSFRFTVD